jgi:hypothetical protein
VSDNCFFPFLDHYKKAKSFSLAPSEVEILISRGSAYKIVTESGTIYPEKTKSFCSKKTNRTLIFISLIPTERYQTHFQQ